jgi:sensor histidine kinase YesM
MKTDEPAFTLISDAYNKNEIKADFYIVIILIINIALHLFLFRAYKLMFPEGMHISVNSLILWIVTIIPFLFALLFIKWLSNATRKHKRQKHAIEKTILQLETKALRAQMNPHFIFNCMNSIKSLIQKNEQDKTVNYLTAFSKLIRTIFQNSDKREITLYDEIETCKLYTQLENMRLGNKFSYEFNVDENIDLKSVMVPALIIQPFIENAIWHGIMPKANGGTLHVNISKKENKIFCIVEDDGIGREISFKNKFNDPIPAHQSKGVSLTQSRLELSNTLNERNASFEIIDKKEDNSSAGGTKVVIVFTED